MCFSEKSSPDRRTIFKREDGLEKACKVTRIGELAA